MSAVARIRTATTALTGAALALISTPAMASEYRFLNEVTYKLYVIHQTFENAIFFIGSFALAVLAIFAFFGKFKWTHFFALAAGIVLIGYADDVIFFFSGGGIATNPVVNPAR